MIYLDADAFAYLFLYEKKDVEHQKAIDLLDQYLTERQNLVTASLTWDEVACYALGKNGALAAEHVGSRFLSFPRLTIAPVTANTIQKANGLLMSGLKPRDAIHAACALENGCRKIVSNDADFDYVKGLKRIPI